MAASLATVNALRARNLEWSTLKQLRAMIKPTFNQIMPFSKLAVGVLPDNYNYNRHATR